MDTLSLSCDCFQPGRRRLSQRLIYELQVWIKVGACDWFLPLYIRQDMNKKSLREMVRVGALTAGIE